MLDSTYQISKIDFDTHVMLFQYLKFNHLFPCLTVSVNFVLVCVCFYFVRSSRCLLCIVISISSLDELFLLLEKML